MKDDKYIVFKLDEFTTWLYGIDNRGTAVEPLADAVVIRRQDMFAPAALQVYASSISLTARLARFQQPDVAKQLQGIADYFHEQAVLAGDEAWKLPD